MEVVSTSVNAVNMHRHSRSITIAACFQYACLPACLPACLSVCLSVYMSVCLSASISQEPPRASSRRTARRVRRRPAGAPSSSAAHRGLPPAGGSCVSPEPSPERPGPVSRPPGTSRPAAAEAQQRRAGRGRTQASRHAADDVSRNLLLWLCVNSHRTPRNTVVYYTRVCINL